MVNEDEHVSNWVLDDNMYYFKKLQKEFILLGWKV